MMIMMMIREETFVRGRLMYKFQSINDLGTHHEALGQIGNCVPAIWSYDSLNMPASVIP
jgi:hypothetical protein